MGGVKCYYEPESVQELAELCSIFYAKGEDFDLIGHTSNTLFTEDYHCERMISTRKLNHFEFRDDAIECECGTSVRQLSLQAIELGVKGFEGLIDLPGTVASAIYGHATCYGCDLSGLLLDATLLQHDGSIVTVTPGWFAFAERSSALKRKEKQGIILYLRLRREPADSTELKRIADNNHQIRRTSQPEAKNSLGSIFFDEGKPTLLNRTLSAITKLYGIMLGLSGQSEERINLKRRHLTFTLLGALDIEPYVRNWNWYQWSDVRSHKLFWKYVRIHKRLFTKSDFEIEIKHNRNFKFP